MFSKSDLKESMASKKFLFAVFAVSISFLFALLAAWTLTEMKSMFETFTGVVEFVVSAYLIGNVTNKAVLGFHSNKSEKNIDNLDKGVEKIFKKFPPEPKK